MTIEALVAKCVGQIESSHAAREQALTTSRSLVRQCANTIRATHRRQFDEAAQMLAEAGQIAARLRQIVAQQPALLTAGYTQDALKEYVEAALVYAFLTGNDMPSAALLNVEPAAYLNGMAEAASELRRAILDGLRRGEVEQGEALLMIIEDVYSALITVDFPDAVTGGLRRTTDALRGVLERTRGDLTAAIRQEHLTKAMAALEAQLTGTTAEGTGT